MDQATEPIAATDPVEREHFAPASSFRWVLGERRSLTKRAVRPMLVVVDRISGHDAFQMPATEDQQPVETFASQPADPALGVRPCPRGSHRRLNHPDPLGAEDLVEAAPELAVAIADQEPGLHPVVGELHKHIPRLLGHPLAVWTRRDPSEPNAARPQLDEKQDVKTLQKERVNSQEIALQDARRLLAQELSPAQLKPLRGWLDPCLPQDRPNRARGELDPEPDQLPLNPPVASARILARKPHHELTDLGRRRRPTGPPTRIRPTACDELPVPAQKRGRRHEERRPRPSWQNSTERSQQRPISLTQLRTSDLPFEHPQLVAKQQDLDLLLPLGAKTKDDELEQTP